MKVSVLISLYNGERYIIDQLDSLYNQTRMPDEVILIDDCSTDDTVNVVQNYITEKNLDGSWRVVRNDKNYGWRINFIRGLDIVSGDYLFYCDQDDIWFDNKIETYCYLLDKDTAINVLVSKETLWMPNEIRPECHIEDLSYEMLDLACKSDEYLIHTSGCCMAIRMNYIKSVRRHCFDGWAHDDFFWKMGILDGSLAYMKSSSILHRITGSNQSRKKKNKEEMEWTNEIDINVAKKMLERLEGEDISAKEQKRRIIQHKYDGSLLKKRMIESKNPFLSLKLLYQYPDIYRRKRQLAGDYLRAIGLMK